jgi:hypothetical protein
MKKQIIPAVILLVLSLVIAIGSQTFLSPCVHGDGSFGPCHWAGQTLLGLGCVLGVLGAFALCVKRARLGVFLSAMPVCVLGILTPGTLIDLCRMSTMRCRMVMQPAMIILFSAALLCSLIGAVLSVRSKTTMRSFSLTIKNLVRKPGRTTVLTLLTAFLALAVFGGSVVVLSLRSGLNSLEARLGADIILVPSEARAR